MRHTENGMMSEMFACIDKQATASIRKDKVQVFETVEAFVDEFSGFSYLVLDNFRFIFLYYFLFGSLSLLAFFVHHLVNKLAKKRNKRRLCRLVRQSYRNATIRILNMLELGWALGRKLIRSCSN